MIDHGFGVILNGEGTSEFRDDAPVSLVNMILKSTCSLAMEFEDYFKENKYSYSEIDDAKIAFVKDFEDDEYGCGLEGLLATFINVNEVIEESLFIYRDSCLYVSAHIPYDEESKKEMLTVKDIERVLALYLNPLLKNGPCSPTWVDVYM